MPRLPLPPADTDTDAALVTRAVAGDEPAMRLLWHRHAAHVDAVVRRLAGDPDLAQDIAQEVWIQLFRALPGWRGESSLRTWIHRLAVNRTLNALRGRRRAEAGVQELLEDTVAVESHDAERRLLAETIEGAVRHLPAGARTVFLLHDVEGYTHEEIAASLGITAGGSKSQLFKARARLRRLLAPLMDPASPAEGEGRADAAS